MNRRVLVQTLALALVAAFVSAGCLSDVSSQGEGLTYVLVSDVTVEVGESVPGTTLQYLGSGERGAHVTIDGQESWKRVGDSLDWSGDLAPCAASDLSLRILSYNDESMHLVGTTTIAVEAPEPREGGTVKTSPVTYGGLVAYGVPVGSVIPGSTIRYEGPTADGAELAGVEGYPYRKAGDSIHWEGTVCPDVHLSLEVRLVQFDEEAMRVAGVVNLWFGS